MVTLRVVRHDRELVLAEVPSDVIPSRGEVLQLDTLDEAGEKSRPSTLWRIVSVTVHVPSLASSRAARRVRARRPAGRGRRPSRRRPRPRVRRGGGEDPFRVEDVRDASVERVTAGDAVAGSRPRSGGSRRCTRARRSCPAHLREWQLPPGWALGIRRAPYPAPPLPRGRRRARAVAVAGNRAERRARTSGSSPRRGTSRTETTRRCRRRTTTGRRSR